MILMIIDSIRMSLITNHRLVVLKAKNAELYLTIWLNICDADALASRLLGTQHPRPLTYNFFWEYVRQTNLSIEAVYIPGVSDGHYRTQVLTARRELGTRRRFTVDCKAGDALLTAAHFEVPIYVSDPIIEKLARTTLELPSKNDDLAAWGETTPANGAQWAKIP